MQLAIAAGAVLGHMSTSQGRHSAAEVPDEDVETVSSKQAKHPDEARQASGIKAIRPQVSPSEGGSAMDSPDLCCHSQSGGSTAQLTGP